MVDLSIEPPGRNPNCSAAVTSCYFSDHASSSGARLWARSYVSRMSEMRTRASTGSCITSRRLTLESGRALPTTDMWSRAQMCQSVTPQLRRVTGKPEIEQSGSSFKLALMGSSPKRQSFVFPTA